LFIHYGHLVKYIYIYTHVDQFSVIYFHVKSSVGIALGYGLDMLKDTHKTIWNGSHSSFSHLLLSILDVPYQFGYFMTTVFPAQYA